MGTFPLGGNIHQVTEKVPGGAGLRLQNKEAVSAIEFKGSPTHGIPRKRTSE